MADPALYPGVYPGVYPGFPAGPLDLRAELNLAGAWTDVSAYAYQRAGTQAPVAITRGRPDETSRATAGGANVELNNRDGRFSPKNPLGAYYGQLGRNTPLRLSVPAQANYLRLEALQARAYVNNDSNLSISGSIDIRIQLSLTDWQGCVLAAKWDGGGCWFWELNANGTTEFLWNDASSVLHGHISSVPVPFTRGSFALRVTMDATTGTVTFYTGTTVSGAWTQLGTAISGTGGAATSILVSSGSPLVVGYSFNIVTGNNLYGRVQEFQLWNGIGGTVAADGVFSAQSAGTTSWTDAQGNLWQLTGGAEISSRDYRWHGETSSLPPRWDPTGTDIAVQVASGGLLRRLGQGNAPIQSPMRRAIALQSGTFTPVQYWPMEDAAGATSFGSATGGPLLGFTGAPTLSSDSAFPGSAPLPKLNGAQFFGRVPTYASNGAIVVRFLVHPGSSGTAGAPVIQVTTTGTCTALSVLWESATNLEFTGTSASGSVFNSGSINFASGLPGGTIQQPLWMSLELTPGGGSTVDFQFRAFPLNTINDVTTGGSFTGTIGNVTAVYIDPAAVFTDWSAGHVSVQSAFVDIGTLGQPLNGWAGEAAGARFVRVLGENGLTARVLGPVATTAPMGVQPVDTLINVLQQCEDADRGLIHEPRQVLGLAYRTLASMLNQSPSVTLDYSQAELGGTGSDLEPTYDDQYVRNDETVTRTNGATYQYQLNDGSAMSIGQPPNGIGDYANSDTVNCQLDTQVPHLARWIVHVGTADVARWPAIPVNLARSEIQGNSLYYPLLGLDVGDFLQVQNMLGAIVADPVSVIVFGTKESLGGIHHEVALNAAPEQPYEVIVLDDPIRGRVDTDGSSLAAAAGTAATSLLVASAGILWTTAAGDVPFDIQVAGERMTVTAVADGKDGGPVTSPGAFANIAFLTPVAAGTYLVRWSVTLAGTLSGSDVNNFAIYNGTTFVTSSTNPAVAGTYVQAPLLMTVTSGAPDIKILTDNAGTTGSQYSAAITSPQSMTVTRSVNGVSKSQAAGTDVRLWLPPILSLT